MNEIVDKALSLGASRAFIIEPGQVPLSWKASLLCLDCNVNKNILTRRWSCPPYSPHPQRTKDILAQYTNCLVINLETKFWPFTNHSFTTRNPFIQLTQKVFCHHYWKKLHFIMLNLKRYLSKRYDIFSWGSSPCHACIKCSYPLRCIKPKSFLFSPEASGIDLYLLARNLDLPIEIPPVNKIQLLSLAVFRT